MHTLEFLAAHFWLLPCYRQFFVNFHTQREKKSLHFFDIFCSLSLPVLLSFYFTFHFRLQIFSLFWFECIFAIRCEFVYVSLVCPSYVLFDADVTVIIIIDAVADVDIVGFSYHGAEGSMAKHAKCTYVSHRWNIILYWFELFSFECLNAFWKV